MCDFIDGPLTTTLNSKFLDFNFLNNFYTKSRVMILIPRPKMSFSHVNAIWKKQRFNQM